MSNIKVYEFDCVNDKEFLRRVFFCDTMTLKFVTIDNKPMYNTRIQYDDIDNSIIKIVTFFDESLYKNCKINSCSINYIAWYKFDVSMYDIKNRDDASNFIRVFYATRKKIYKFKRINTTMNKKCLSII